MNSPIKNEYSIREKFQLGWWLLKTKLLNPKARLIRFPFTIRGGGYIDLGKGLTTGVGCRLEAFRMNDDRHKRIISGKNSLTSYSNRHLIAIIARSINYLL